MVYSTFTSVNSGSDLGRGKEL